MFFLFCGVSPNSNWISIEIGEELQLEQEQKQELEQELELELEREQDLKLELKSLDVIYSDVQCDDLCISQKV